MKTVKIFIQNYSGTEKPRLFVSVDKNKLSFFNYKVEIGIKCLSLNQ